MAIALWLALALLAPAARHNSLFEGMLVFEDGAEVLWTCFIVYLSAAMLMVFTNLVLFYGDTRLNGSKAPLSPKPAPNNRRTLIVFIVCLLPPTFFITYTDCYTLAQQSAASSHELTGATVFVWTLGGFCCAVAGVLVAKLLQVLFATPLPGQKGEPHFIVPLGWVPVLGPWYERLYRRPGLLSRTSIERSLQWLDPLISRWRRWFANYGEGYFDYTADGQLGPALPGQAFAASLAVVVFLSYEISGWGHLRRLMSAELAKSSLSVPTVSHVLIAFLFLATLLSGMAFFFDRYRIPLTLVVATVLVVSSVPTSFWHGSDHLFDLAPGTSVSLLTPREALLKKKRKRFIAIAAAGGGIQAAAWTAKVLCELRTTSGNIQAGDFAGAVGVMSGVSGGSVGILNYLTTYGLPGSTPVAPAQAISSAEHDSLEGIAWGLVHPDFWRIVFPFAIPGARDRGWALERLVAQSSGTSGLRLSQLAQRAGELPALLISSTEAESGAPMVFPSTDFPPHEAAAGIDNFRSVYGAGADIPVPTAVRLSATFPYVSPAARSSFGSSYFHFVDGGYYDTFGMVSLVEWIRAALLKRPNQPPSGTEEPVSEDMADKQILILEINGFPPAGVPVAYREPWPYQIIAPILALYDVRDHSQQARNHFEFQIQSQAQLFHGRVLAVEFRYNPKPSDCKGSPPLSWHLTPRERSCIEDAWSTEDAELTNAKACVAAFLSGRTGDVASTCKLPVERGPSVPTGN